MGRRTCCFVLLLLLAPFSAAAGTVTIENASRQFSLSVRVKDNPQDGSTPLTGNGGVFETQFSASDFQRSAYARRIFVLTWTPLEADKPATGVRPFTLELPVLLRAWRVDDRYTIRADAFEGIGNRWLTYYEQMTNAEDQWIRLFASLQQADHYSHRIRPTVPEVRRAVNTAVDGLSRIAQNLPVTWLEPPLGLQQKLDHALADDARKRAQLSEALANVNSLVWRDVPELERVLSGRSCEVIRNTVGDLDRRRRDDPRSFALQFASDNKTYETVRERLLQASCSN